MIELQFHYAWVQSIAAFLSGVAFTKSYVAWCDKRPDDDQRWFITGTVLVFVASMVSALP